FDEIRWSFHEGLASVRLGDKWGFIDKSSKFVIDPNLEYGHVFYEGRSIINITENGQLRHAVIDTSGKPITTQSFEWSGWEYEDGLLNVKINGKWGYIDRDGNFVIPPTFHDALEFSEGVAAVEFSDGKNQWGYIDKNGKVVIPAQFTRGDYFRD